MIEWLAVLAGILAVCKIKGWKVVQFAHGKSPVVQLVSSDKIPTDMPLSNMGYSVSEAWDDLLPADPVLREIAVRAAFDSGSRDIEKRMFLADWTARGMSDDNE